MESAALDLLAGAGRSERPPGFDLSGRYAGEMSLPEVQRIHDHYRDIDTPGIFAAALARSGYHGRNFMYGDTAVPVIYRLLQRIGADSEDVFFDLGCGCGMPVLTASMLVKKAVGIDLIPGAIQFCRLSQAALGLDNVEFRTGDLLRTNLTEASIVFVAATAFDFLGALRERLLTVRPGTVVVSVTHSFEAPSLQLVESIPMEFSWTREGTDYPFRFHVHRRLP
ncbi:MAG: methyltransferase domain-containing protein [Armatimonadetes bacterium]|nr:methyltransferase domain-containing protein [Armatimonadota bacterium]